MKHFSWLFMIILLNVFSTYAGETLKTDSMKTITLLPDKPFKVDDNLTITVVYIVEKWLPPNRRPVMEIPLDFKMNGKVEQMIIDSDHPHFEWKGYEFNYVGGWRYEVKLQILKEPH
jgi:hypothetical protein